jgi:hypothetical protein
MCCHQHWPLQSRHTLFWQLLAPHVVAHGIPPELSISFAAAAAAAERHQVVLITCHLKPCSNACS